MISLLQEGWEKISSSAQKETSFFLLTLPAAALFLGSVHLVRKQNIKKIKTHENCTDNDNDKSPPKCTFIELKELSAVLAGKEAPMKLLKIRDKMGVPNYELPMPSFLPRFFIVTDYKSARTVLEHPTNSRKPKNIIYNDILKSTTCDKVNFISANGQRWKHVRKSTSTAFTPANIKKMVKAISIIVDTWIDDVLKPSIEKNKGINILEEMNKITATVICKIAFDYDISDKERNAFLDDLLTCWTEFGVNASDSIVKQLSSTKWMFPGIRKGQRASKRMFNLCQKMLNEYRLKGENEKQPHKIIHMMIHDDEYKSDVERVCDLMVFAIAGFDTTANTLSFTLMELAKCKEEQTKLREALRNYSVTKGEEEGRNCPELKNVVRETLRMYPAVATGVLREVTGDITLPTTNSNRSDNSNSSDNSSNKVLPSGSLVITSFYAIQRDGNVFENPNVFNPARWENPTKDQTMSLLTFSYGMRNCLGQRLANAEMNEVLAKLCSTYEFSVIEEGEAQNVVLYKPVGTILSAKVSL
jgi:cytochrome P450